MKVLFSDAANKATGNNMVSQLAAIFDKVAQSTDQKVIQGLLEDAQKICTTPDRIELKTNIDPGMKSNVALCEKAAKDPSIQREGLQHRCRLIPLHCLIEKEYSNE